MERKREGKKIYKYIREGEDEGEREGRRGKGEE